MIVQEVEGVEEHLSLFSDVFDTLEDNVLVSVEEVEGLVEVVDGLLVQFSLLFFGAEDESLSNEVGDLLVYREESLVVR